MQFRKTGRSLLGRSFVYFACLLLIAVSFSKLTAAYVLAPTWTPEIQSKAEKGDAEAEAQMCFFRCYQPLGIKPNCTEGEKWCRKAADQGSRTGQCLLGQIYDEGKGVKLDHEEAFKWFAKGECAAGLAKSYRYGVGVKRDYSEAERWYNTLEEQTHTAEDRAEFARFYLDGDQAHSPDFEKAFFWMSAAAYRNHGNEYDALRDDIEKHLTDAQREKIQQKLWLRFPPSPNLLRIISNETVKASRGDVQAQLFLAQDYAAGDDVQRDYAKTYFWYSLAARNADFKDTNVIYAKKFAKAFAAKLTPQQKADIDAQLRAWKPLPQVK